MTRTKRSLRYPFWLFGVAIFLVLLFCDQFTKDSIVRIYSPGEGKQLVTGASLTYVQNTGMTWGLFQGANAILIGISLVALACLLFALDRERKTVARVSLVLIVTGLAGNLIDRVVRGFVVDFLAIGWWPVFNIADSAIVVGVIVYVLEQWRKEGGNLRGKAREDDVQRPRAKQRRSKKGR